MLQLSIPKALMQRPTAAKPTVRSASTRQLCMPSSRRVCKVYAVAEEVAAHKSGMCIFVVHTPLIGAVDKVALLHLSNILCYTPARTATVKRETKETKVEVSINLDGTGVCTSQSQIPFLDHMMDVRLGVFVGFP